jgi:hypothetical protein
LAAGRATEQLPGGAVGSLSRAGRSPHRRAVMVAARRMRCPHRNTVRHPAGRRLVMGPSCPHACRVLVTLSASSVSVQVSGVRCPVSGVRACDVHASGVQCPGVWVSNVRVWTSGVPRRCPRCPHRATSWNASARAVATRPGGSGRPAISANGSGSCPSQSRAARPAQAMLGQRRRRAEPGRHRGRRSGSGPSSTTWPARDTPVARQDRRRSRNSVPRAVRTICGMAPQVVRAMLAGIR